MCSLLWRVFAPSRCPTGRRNSTLCLGTTATCNGGYYFSERSVLSEGVLSSQEYDKAFEQVLLSVYYLTERANCLLSAARLE